jgi:hypothetical protein
MSNDQLQDLIAKVLENGDLRDRLLSDPATFLDFEEVAREAGMNTPLGMSLPTQELGAGELEAVAGGNQNEPMGTMCVWFSWTEARGCGWGRNAIIPASKTIEVKVEIG